MYNKNLKNTLQIQYHKIHITIKKKILIHKINQNKNYLMINNYISKMKVFFFNTIKLCKTNEKQRIIKR